MHTTSSYSSMHSLVVCIYDSYTSSYCINNIRARREVPADQLTIGTSSYILYCTHFATKVCRYPGVMPSRSVLQSVEPFRRGAEAADLIIFEFDRSRGFNHGGSEPLLFRTGELPRFRVLDDWPAVRWRECTVVQGWEEL
jgi:hypothetical protein